jgi:sulfite reductase (NADPH) flavoprotein alpha-component
MSDHAALALPRTAPFDAEQISALDRVIGASNPLQRAWLTGFLAGLDAAAGKAAAPAAPTVKIPLLILYGTESGNTEALAGRAKQEAARRGFAARVADMADTDIASLKNAGNLLLIVSTWGDGEPPQRAAMFYRALMADSAPRLDNLAFSVLALGDSSYAQFCETGRVMDARLEALGATRIAPRLECDLDYEAPAQDYVRRLLETLTPDAGSVIHVDFHKSSDVPSAISKATPLAAPISAHHLLTSSRSDSATYHVELDLAGSGLTYEPGDSLGVLPENDPSEIAALKRAAGLGEDRSIDAALSSRLDIATLTPKLIADYATLTNDAALADLSKDEGQRAAFIEGRQVIDLLESFPHPLSAAQLSGLLRPLQPRYYSIASSQKLVGEEAHLTIARLAYESAGRARQGVASTMLADRRRAGENLNIFVKPNTHFRLPEDPAASIIMVGAGTGLAPYRAFLQEREATKASGPSWLIFGHRTFTHDFLYQLEIQDWVERGIITDLDLAFSRDQPEKRYVQHALWAKRDALKARLDDGATLYLCGDAKHMARDVEAMLKKILGATESEGQDKLDGLIRAGRYKKDVY